MECKIEPYSSRMCEKGTKSCVIKHLPNIIFSIDEYDNEGDVTEEGVFLHFDNTRIKIVDNKDDFYLFTELIKIIEQEIKENY